MQKTGANLNALTRVAQYMNREKNPGELWMLFFVTI